MKELSESVCRAAVRETDNWSRPAGRLRCNVRWLWAKPRRQPRNFAEIGLLPWRDEPRSW